MVFSVAYHGDNGARLHVLDKRGEEGLGGEVGVVVLEEVIASLLELEGNLSRACVRQDQSRPCECEDASVQMDVCCFSFVFRLLEFWICGMIVRIFSYDVARVTNSCANVFMLGKHRLLCWLAFALENIWF